MTFATLASVMKHFRPLRTYPPSTSRATVRMPATSEPAPGSVIAIAPLMSPAANGGSQRARCSAEPAAMIDSPAWCCPTTIDAAVFDTAASSSMISLKVCRLSPRPPYSGG